MPFAVDAVVLVEAPVLDGEHRVDEVRAGRRPSVIGWRSSSAKSVVISAAAAVEHVRALRLLVHLRAATRPYLDGLGELGAGRNEEREAARQGCTPDRDDQDERDEESNDLHECYQCGTTDHSLQGSANTSGGRVARFSSPGARGLPSRARAA